MEVYFLQPFLDIEARTALADPGDEIDDFLDSFLFHEE